ncbi:putative JmjC domain-containing hydroxylase [Elsinoe fawcettii]|nr:putative JmjC domain-containing hydroxylase [Elsinoe fawcettii]
MDRTGRPTFKPLYEGLHTYARLRSPEAPPIEPLSPTLPPKETPYSAFLKSYIKQEVKPVKGKGSHQKQPRARKTPQEKTPRTANEHKRKSSNTIDELAQVALAVSEPLASQSRNPSYPFSNTYSQHPITNGAHWGSPPAPVTPSSRPTKRARSEAFVHSSYSYQQHARPATSNVPPQQPLRTPASTDYEAAALLLAFGGHAPTAAPIQAPPPLPPPVAPYAFSHPRTPSLPVPPQLQHHWVNPTPIFAPVPPPIPASLVVTEPSYLPSPQPTAEEPHISSKEPSDHDARGSEGPMEDVKEATKHSQIHTPPEEPVQATAQLGDSASVIGHHQEVESTPTEFEEARPKRKGWPKGKPRGPRKSGTTTTSKPKSTGRRGRKPAAAKNAGEAPPPRRKSFSDYDLPHSSLDCETSSRSNSIPPNCHFVPGKSRAAGGKKALPKLTKDTVCGSCTTARESAFGGESDTWISCNGCKKWFHADCAGFKSIREVHDIDKYFCNACESAHGQTTFVRKSTRAHTAVDYAGLNQGVLKTSDDCKEHHYIQSIKDGTFKFDEEAFPRMRPELVTADYFERSACFNQPVLIPAEFNPKPGMRQDKPTDADISMNFDGTSDPSSGTATDELLPDFEYESVPDDGQDKLDMVIPQDLTVRKVCTLVGPDYPLDVIDTKNQGTEGRMWNLGRWADYYELDGEKDIRNVISLEVSATKLGRLLRRPKVVRQIDLQDNVWPAEEPAKSVAFYCLMSAADSYTDFHIDFGGSSVYYHILRGSKTFFFIPPKAKHLKAYEDWNNSPQQNFTFLPNITKECYRVDLFEGDTMLIPSGWIHAVWTPSNSLVIGGNFLTHMHYSMQFRVVEVEKANKTPQKFRYPKFQKVMWYALLRYLREDPLPANVRDTFYSGERFQRDVPVWQEFDLIGDSSEKGGDFYNARYYSQQELDGLPELVSFIFRTVMISQDRIEGVTVESRKAVIASIPKSQGDPLELAKTFALWVAWKRGNEDPPAWAHPDAGLPEKEANGEKKLSAKMLKQMQRHEAFEAWKLAPGRQSARQKEQEAAKAKEIEDQREASLPPQQFTSTPKTSGLGPKRIACDACRRRRIRCKHKEQFVEGTAPGTSSMPRPERRNSREFDAVVIPRMSKSVAAGIPPAAVSPGSQAMKFEASISDTPYTPAHTSSDTISVAPLSGPQFATPSMPSLQYQTSNADNSARRGRSKACADCRKSKRRCVHDENGQIDPVKEKQAPIPRSNATKKRKSTDGPSSETKRPKKEPREPQRIFPGPVYSSGYSEMQPNIQVAPGPSGHQQMAEETMAIDPHLDDFEDMIAPEAYQDYQDANHVHPTTSFEHFAAQALQQSNLADAVDPSLMDLEPDGGEPVPKRASLVATHETGSTDSAVAMTDGELPVAHDGSEPTHSQSTQHVDADDSTIGKARMMDMTADNSALATTHVPMPNFEQSSNVDHPVEHDDMPTTAATESGVLPASGPIPGQMVSSTKPAQSIEQHEHVPPRTPAANDPPSLSSASSPLSSTHATPEPTEPVYQSTEPTTNRQSSRSSKPVERFASGNFAGSLLSQSGSPTKSKIASSSKTLVNGHQRASSPSTTPDQNGMPTSLLRDVIAVMNGIVPEARSKSKTPGREIKSEEQMKDEESIRLARELAGENFGLRARSGLSSELK